MKVLSTSSIAMGLSYPRSLTMEPKVVEGWEGKEHRKGWKGGLPTL